MNKEFFAKIYKLSMNYPSIDLIVEDFVTGVKYLCKHGLDNRVSRDASSGDFVQELSSF